MAKQKTTITVERSKLDEARRLTGAPSTSAIVDLALDRLIRSERLRKDVVAYTGTPPTDEDVARAAMTPRWSDLTDETDWEDLYSEDQ